MQEDLTTLLVTHLRTLLPGDQTTDLDAYLETVRQLNNSLDDINTAIALDLP
jgi:hypothetical protein